MTINLSQLKKVCEAATPGPWASVYDGSSDWSVGPAADPQGKGRIGFWRPGAADCPDATFVATFNPEMVKKLLDAVEVLQRIAACRSQGMASPEWMADQAQRALDALSSSQEK